MTELNRTPVQLAPNVSRAAFIEKIRLGVIASVRRAWRSSDGFHPECVVVALATLQTAPCAIELVSAASWKRALGLFGTDKRASLNKARLLFRSASLERKKDHGRAEALLVAYSRLNRNTARAVTVGARGG